MIIYKIKLTIIFFINIYIIKCYANCFENEKCQIGFKCVFIGFNVDENGFEQEAGECISITYGKSCNSDLNCDGSEICIKNICKNDEPGINCGNCGKSPINGRCCGKGIIDNIKKTGLCYCGESGGCKEKRDCRANSDCCIRYGKTTGICKKKVKTVLTGGMVGYVKGCNH